MLHSLPPSLPPRFPLVSVWPMKPTDTLPPLPSPRRPPLTRNLIREVSLYIFPALLATNKPQEERGSAKLLLSTCLAQISSHRNVHDCPFLLLVPNREWKPDKVSDSIHECVYKCVLVGC